MMIKDDHPCVRRVGGSMKNAYLCCLLPLSEPCVCIYIYTYIYIVVLIPHSKPINNQTPHAVGHGMFMKFKPSTEKTKINVAQSTSFTLLACP